MIHSLKKLLKSNYLFTLGILICLGWILAAVLAPVVAPYDPIAQDLSLRLKAPSAIHWFGTDNFGRDIFSRVIYGGRYSLLAGCLSVIIAGIIGTFYGALAGYVGGWLECHKRIPLPSCPFAHVHLEQDTGDFTVTGHKLELYGYCKKCQEARENH